jgi:cytochrome c-type biogenesis protein CcmH
MPTTEAAIDYKIHRDLYLTLGDPQDNGGWAVRTYIKPFANWLWAGCISDGAGRYFQPVGPSLPCGSGGQAATDPPARCQRNEHVSHCLSLSLDAGASEHLRLPCNPTKCWMIPCWKRARAICPAGLRCLVCRNESIDESNADLARDMRLLVRERLVEGDSNDQVVAFIVERYGEYVLLRPTTEGTNLLLWIAAPTLFLIAMGSSIVYLRRRERAPELAGSGLDADEERRLKELLKE